MRNWIKHFRERAGLTQEKLAQKIGMSNLTISRYESGIREPRASDITRLCAALNTTEAMLLNGPTPNEIQVRILIKESLDEMEVIDLSKDAPYLETVTLTPNKNSVTVVFDGDKTLGDAIEKILQEKEKIEKAREELFGENHSAA